MPNSPSTEKIESSPSRASSTYWPFATLPTFVPAGISGRDLLKGGLPERVLLVSERVGKVIVPTVIGCRPHRRGTEEGTRQDERRR